MQYFQRIVDLIDKSIAAVAMPERGFVGISVFTCRSPLAEQFIEPWALGQIV